MYQQHSALFYLLYNLEWVKPAQLFSALHLQLNQNWFNCTSFCDILLESGYITHRQLSDLRDVYRELDEEPLVHLLLDGGLIQLKQYTKLNQMMRENPGVYPGQIIVQEQLLTELQIRAFLSQGFRGFAREINTLEAQQYLFECRELLKQRFINRGYFSPGEMPFLQQFNTPRISIMHKPLLDLLLVCGDIPVDTARILLKGDCSWENDPLLPLLACRGFQIQSLLGFIQKYPVEERQGNFALELVKAGQISHFRLKEAILETYRNFIPQIA